MPKAKNPPQGRGHLDGSRKSSKLPPGTKVVKRKTLLRPAIPSPYMGAQSPKVVYIRKNTPFMSAVQRVKRLLSEIEKRAAQSTGRQASRDKTTSDRILAAASVDLSNIAAWKEEVSIKGTGRAIEKVLSLAAWFCERETELGIKVSLATDTTSVIDDIELREDSADNEELPDVPESRLRNCRSHSLPTDSNLKYQSISWQSVPSFISCDPYTRNENCYSTHSTRHTDNDMPLVIERKPGNRPQKLELQSGITGDGEPRISRPNTTPGPSILIPPPKSSILDPERSPGFRATTLFQCPIEQWPDMFSIAIGKQRLYDREILESRDPLPPPDLPSSIHPVFDFRKEERWSSDKDHRFMFLDAFNLGLRLASFILTSDRSVEWIAKAWLNPFGAEPRVPRDEIYIKDEPITRTKRLETLSFLLNIVPHWFKLGFDEPLFDQDGHELLIPYGQTWNARWYVDPRYANPRIKHRYLFGINLDLHAGFHSYALEVSAMTDCQRQRPAQYAVHLRTNMLFAVTLLHEFIHVIELLRTSYVVLDSMRLVKWFHEMTSGDTTELYTDSFFHPFTGFRYPNHYAVHFTSSLDSNEWGCKYENDIFTSGFMTETPTYIETKISPPYYPVPVFGLVAHDHYTHVDENYKCIADGRPPVAYVLPMKYVNSWFQQHHLRQSHLFRSWQDPALVRMHPRDNDCLNIQAIPRSPWYAVV